MRVSEMLRCERLMRHTNMTRYPYLYPSRPCCDAMTLYTHCTHCIIVLTPLSPYLHLCRLQLTTSNG